MSKKLTFSCDENDNLAKAVLETSIEYGGINKNAALKVLFTNLTTEVERLRAEKKLLIGKGFEIKEDQSIISKNKQPEQPEPTTSINQCNVPNNTSKMSGEEIEFNITENEPEDNNSKGNSKVKGQSMGERLASKFRV